jgi:sugar O-acyltransferase (sialic acid O-acetyltransferase NeuD family)
MKTREKIAIVGAGGFAREVLCLLIDSWSSTRINYKKMVCFIERDEIWKQRRIMEVDVIPQSMFNPEQYQVLIGIGDPETRSQVVDELPANTTFATVIHPSVVTSKWVEIGEGGIVCAGTILTCNIKIGRHAQLNLHTTVGHDCQIGNFFTSAPGVNISGRCTFGNKVYFGTNASIKEGIQICDGVTIGMGAVVIKDIKESGVYVGNPVRKLQKTSVE